MLFHVQTSGDHSLLKTMFDLQNEPPYAFYVQATTIESAIKKVKKHLKSKKAKPREITSVKTVVEALLL